jgi:hypothetical protein
MITKLNNFLDKWFGFYCGAVSALMLFNINQFASGFMCCVAVGLFIRNMRE